MISPGRTLHCKQSQRQEVETDSWFWFSGFEYGSRGLGREHYGDYAIILISPTRTSIHDFYIPEDEIQTFIFIFTEIVVGLIWKMLEK